MTVERFVFDRIEEEPLYPDDLKYTSEHEWVRVPGESDGCQQRGLGSLDGPVKCGHDWASSGKGARLARVFIRPSGGPML